MGIAVSAAAATLAGCGVRLEDDAPRVPLVPTRSPVPSEIELIALTRETDRLAQVAALSGGLSADLATIHRRQHAVLRTTLVREQVPPDGLDATPAPGGSPSPSPTGSPPPSPKGSPTGVAALAEEEARSAAGSGAFAGVSADLLAPVAALHAQRYAAASLLSGAAPGVPAGPLTGDDVAALAASTAASIWFLQVVAARSTATRRARADATLAALNALFADQVAGGSRPPDALGHPLPFPVATAADAARLARESLTALRSEHGTALQGLVSGHGAAGAEAATRWLGTVEVEAHRWGVALEPFPGLT